MKTWDQLVEIFDCQTGRFLQRDAWKDVATSLLYFNLLFCFKRPSHSTINCIFLVPWLVCILCLKLPELKFYFINGLLTFEINRLCETPKGQISSRVTSTRSLLVVISSRILLIRRLNYSVRFKLFKMNISNFQYEVNLYKYFTVKFSSMVKMVFLPQYPTLSYKHSETLIRSHESWCHYNW